VFFLRSLRVSNIFFCSEQNTGPGIAIFQVNATDADLGVNAELTYSLVAEQSDGGFDVDRAGWIVTYGLLDRETKPSQQVRWDAVAPVVRVVKYCAYKCNKQQGIVSATAGCRSLRSIDHVLPPLKSGRAAAKLSDMEKWNESELRQIKASYIN